HEQRLRSGAAGRTGRGQGRRREGRRQGPVAGGGAYVPDPGRQAQVRTRDDRLKTAHLRRIRRLQSPGTGWAGKIVRGANITLNQLKQFSHGTTQKGTEVSRQATCPSALHCRGFSV